jgi:hypothetical protein
MVSPLVTTQTHYTDAQEFAMSVKTRNFALIQQQLQSILSLPTRQRSKWVKEHHYFLQDLVDDCAEDAMDTLDGLQMSETSLSQSREFLVSFRETMYTLQGILTAAIPKKTKKPRRSS